MTSLLTRIAVGTVAAAAAISICATAAFAEVTNVSKHGMYTVMADAPTKTCALGAGNANATLILAHSGKDHKTSILYSENGIPNLTGQVLPVTVVIDSKEYDWKATGTNGGVEITTPDTAFPTALTNAQIWGVMVGDTTLFALKSDANFEAALNATLACAHKLGAN